uniref:Uncharacterized protein n=1 Tax=Microcebus murinus TaxID=30608 RepID=A0A8C5W4Y7_MICMU
MAVQISKKRKFVADGTFRAVLNEFLTQKLAEDDYSGAEVQATPTRTEIIILATRTENVLGEKVVQKRFGFPEGNVELYAEKVATRSLCAFDPTGKIGPKKLLPDHISIMEPKDETLPTTPISKQKAGKPEPPATPQPVPTA